MKKGGCLKKIIIVVIVLFAVFMLIGMLSSDDESTKDKSSNSKVVTPTVKVIPTEKASKDNKSSSSSTDASKSNSKKSKEDSADITALELYSTLQDNEMIPYTLNNKAKKFLDNHDDLFPTQKSIDDDLIDHDLDYKHINKNDSLYGNKLMEISSATVVQIQEENIGEGELLTSVNIIDSDGQQYYILYNGALKDVFEDDIIDAVGLPLGNSSFTNTDGGETLVVVLAGANVTKQEGLGE